MKNIKNVSIVAALTIPAVFVWYEARNETRITTAVATPVPAALVATPVVGTPVAVAPPLPAPVIVTIDDDGAIKHVAQPGETVTSLAVDILGKDTKTNRDAIINANSSLKANPDKLLAGQSYHIPAAEAVPATEVKPSVAKSAVVESAPEAEAPVAPAAAQELKYTATPGDTVGKLASAFLGSDDQANQNAIINANSSLKADPDRVLVGKTYRIPAPDGLSASATTPTVGVTRRPATQPDSDQVIAAGSQRILRYTALDGDTVTTLAMKLLGSDTQNARDTIINNNSSLRLNPDRLIAGQTYSIPAPAFANVNP